LHKIYTKTDQLSLFLLKLYKAVTPSLNIVDGILALEGNGPAKTGKPKKLGVVVVGDDALYTDYAIGRLLGLEDKANPLIRMAKKEGLLSAQELELISEISFGAFKDFKFPASFIVDVLPKPLVSFMKLFLKFKPAIDKNKCTGCLECLKICPNGAMKPMARKAEIDYSRCLVCMCCQEVCRQAAIDLDKGLLLRIAESIRSQSLI
jgi:Pyruvate/2-oxoacid:ferredoxin oxidoreductase delta subunit